MNKDIESILSMISFVKNQLGNDAWLSIDDQNQVVLWESYKGDAGIVAKWNVDPKGRKSLVDAKLINEFA
jgi:hypothetical protein